MPTITTLIGVMVVWGLVIAGLIVLVKVLANTASRNDQTLRINLDLRRLRIKLSITPTQSRSVPRLPTPDDGSHSSRTSEKTS